MQFIKIEPIIQGWSYDKKYRVEDQEGRVYFLRRSERQIYPQRQKEYHYLQELAKRNLPICLPIDLRQDAEGVYFLQSWINGQDAREVMKSFLPKVQYDFGLEAGKVLLGIHSVPLQEEPVEWEMFYGRKMDRKLKEYQESPVKLRGGQVFIDYIHAQRHLLKDRPVVFQHGDYHVGNMMIDDKGKLVVVDFDRCDLGDPWEEFNRIVWSAQVSPAFASGLVDGYFDFQVPHDFWRLLALYIAVNSLGSLSWAVPFGPDQVKIMQNQADEILEWYDHMKTIIPKWYR